MIKIAIATTNSGFHLSSHALIYLMDNGSNLVQSAPCSDFSIDPKDDRATKIRGDFFESAYGLLFDRKKELVYFIGLKPGEDNTSISFRSHPDIIACVKTLGVSAAAQHCAFKIITIEDVDPNTLYIHSPAPEHVAVKHMIWR